MQIIIKGICQQISIRINKKDYEKLKRIKNENIELYRDIIFV